MTIPLVLAVILMAFWIVTLVLVAFLLIECVAACRYAPSPPAAGSLDDVLVLIPAHNEAGTLPRCLESLMADGVPPQQIAVVANDCHDETADVARGAGVRVFEFRDPARRLKARGLSAALSEIARDPPATVVFVDADSWIAAAGSMRVLSAQVAATGRPAQAVFLQRSTSGSSMARMSTFAFRVRNLVRPLGSLRLGWPCLLFGSGMAVPWRLVANGLECDDDEPEDYRLAITLALQGAPPGFCPSAMVESLMSEEARVAAHQRHAWIARHLRIVLRYGGALFREALRQRAVPLAVLALEIAVPPLSLLTGVMAAALVASAVLAASGPAAPLWLGGAATAMFGAALVTAWINFGRATMSLRDLLCAPAYVADQTPTHVTTVTSEIRRWR